MSIALPTHLTDDQLFDFCQVNQDLRIERTADRELIIMAPKGGETGSRSATLTTLLTFWSWVDGTGESFGATLVFIFRIALCAPPMRLGYSAPDWRN